MSGTRDAFSLKNKRRVSLILNLVTVLFELTALFMSAGSYGTRFFRFYTQDSNLLALAACALCAVFTAVSLKTGRAVPLWVSVLKFTASCTVALTFVVVVTVLAPPEGLHGYLHLLFSREMLFVHFLCPVLCVLSFVLFEHENRISGLHTFYALVPTLAYAAVMIVLNLAGVLSGPYRFFLVYQQPVYMSVLWAVLILAAAYLIIWAIRRLNLAAGKRSAKQGKS